MISLPGLVPRRSDAFIAQLVAEEPAVMMEGPRGSGKSTLLRAIAKQFGGRVVDLDDAATLKEIQAGSDAPLTSSGL